MRHVRALSCNMWLGQDGGGGGIRYSPSIALAGRCIALANRRVRSLKAFCPYISANKIRRSSVICSPCFTPVFGIHIYEACKTIWPSRRRRMGMWCKLTGTCWFWILYISQKLHLEDSAGKTFAVTVFIKWFSFSWRNPKFSDTSSKYLLFTPLNLV